MNFVDDNVIDKIDWISFQNVISTVPNTPNSHTILPNAFRFDQAQLKKQHTIF